MAQGTRVVGNLMHDNLRDVFAEVNHGPALFASNILLSANGLWCASDGLAWAHNLVTGSISANADGRTTPYMQPHSTTSVANVAIPLGAE